MDDSRIDDMLTDLYWAVREEGQLFEVPLGRTDRLPTGPVVHGPWSPADCAAVMTRWLKLSWLILYRRLPSDQTAELTLDEATAVLADPGDWVVTSTIGLLCLAPSDSGVSIPMPEWIEAASWRIRRQG